MPQELEQEVHRLHLGDHLCQLYDSPADTPLIAIPFVRDGLERRERCLYLADSSDAQRTVESLLTEAGVPVEQARERGALQVACTSGSSALELPFRPRAMLEFITSALRDALADGFAGLRICGEAPWPAGALAPDNQALIEMEGLINEASSQREVLIICRFDAGRFRAGLLEDMVRVHPKVVVGPLVCPNPAFEPPRIAIAGCSDEERLRWSVDRLYRFRSAHLALEEAAHSRDEFLAVASHELRTPLTSTQLNLQTVLRSAERRADDQLSATWTASKLRTAQEQLRRLGELVERLLETAQLPEHPMNFEFASVDLAEVVNTVRARLEQPLTRARCSLEFLPPASPVVGRWDRLRLEQVGTELLSNAIKFGAGAAVQVSVSTDGVSAYLAVRDHGIGIPEGAFERIFERFERAVPVNNYGGFGLGLWTVKRIVEAFGGSVTASTPPGGGSSFTVCLPLDGGSLAASG